jgi:ornithine cyclodeaminase/alanine dehydrogenase-like protein (mu-crystallin family)
VFLFFSHLVDVRSTLRRVTIVNRSRARADALAAALCTAYAALQPPLTVNVLLLSEKTAVAAAVRASQIVCVATNAAVPVLKGSWLAAGAHVNAVGAYTPTMQELDAATVTRCRVVCDSQHALACGDFAIPIAEGSVATSAFEYVRELGEYLTVGNNDHSGGGAVTAPPALRLQSSDVTLFKSKYCVGVQSCDID